MTTSTSTLIEDRLGLATDSQHREDFALLLRELASGDEQAYQQALAAAAEHSRPWQALIQALAIGETYFFRDQAHFNVLRSHVLPDLIQRQRIEARRTGRSPRLSIWSAGCATGEEPYSIAMLLHDLLPDRSTWTLHILGTDVNARALDIARQGLYRAWSFRQMAPHYRVHFEQRADGYQLKPGIRQMVRFQQENLFAAGRVPRFDLVMCRNVLLYFTPRRTQDAESLLYDVLRPGGWLFLGQSEMLGAQRPGWVTHLFPGSPIYQKQQADAQADERRFHTTPLKPRAAPAPASPHPASDPPASDADDRSRRYERALRARAESRLMDAESLLRGLIARDPSDAAAHLLLAVVLADQRQLDAARQAIDAALHVEPLLADAYYLRGLICYEQGDAALARQALEQALYCQRHHPLASFLLGVLHSASGDIPRAVRLWEQAKLAVDALQPESPLSDISDITAARLTSILDAQLSGWH